MSHRDIMRALTGLLLGMFVAILSSTIVTNALPAILTDLNGGQSAYTWVVTSTLLATTATTPLWGKLADLTSKKLLVQLALVIYVIGSLIAGLSQNIGELIVARTIQGVGVGGLIALAQVVMAAMIAPRERGRYSGYLGAVFAVATVGGPLIGGMIVDTSWLGWRWCFGVGIPVAALALVVLQKTLHLPVVRRKAKVDYLGATLITAAVSLLLIWVSLGGEQFDWLSWQTAVMVPGALVLGVLFGWVETRASEPIIPLHLFGNRTIVLATAASLFVGVAMFGSSVFLSQYFQVARGDSPTASGLMSLPMIAGLVVASTVSGRVISATGRWKRFLVVGAALITVGFGLLGTARADTHYGLLSLYMALLGVGLGMSMQNLVLAVQNTVKTSELGTASSTVAFFRSLGGAVGVSALGAVLGHRVTDYVADGLRELGVSSSTTSGGLPDLSTLPPGVRAVVQDAYGHAAGDIFLVATPFLLLAFVAVLFIRETALRTSNTDEPVSVPVTDGQVVDPPAAVAAIASTAPARGDAAPAEATAATRTTRRPVAYRPTGRREVGRRAPRRPAERPRAAERP